MNTCPHCGAKLEWIRRGATATAWCETCRAYVGQLFFDTVGTLSGREYPFDPLRGAEIFITSLDNSE